jgi:hypothetical protein
MFSILTIYPASCNVLQKLSANVFTKSSAHLCHLHFHKWVSAVHALLHIYGLRNELMNCFTSHLDQYCWNVINTSHQGYKWDKNFKADIMVEWVFLALDNKRTVNTIISSFHSQKVRKLFDKVNKYNSLKYGTAICGCIQSRSMRLQSMQQA